MGRINSVSWQTRLRFLFLTFLGLTIALMVNFPFWAVAQTPKSNTASNVINQVIDQVIDQETQSTPINQPPQPLTRGSNGNELRGVWLTNVDSDVLFSADRLEKAVKRLKRLNFNTIYPTIWNRGYTLYPSKVAEANFGVPVYPIPELQNRDMLAEAIAIGHKHNFAVIPWFEYGLKTEEGSELMQKHPEWVTMRQDGSHLFLHGENDQHRLAWLNPAHPEVQKLLVDLIVEVVKKYDLDGIQLDDHFGMPAELGYDDYTLALYKKSHGGRLPPADFKDPEWMQWRAKSVTNLMTKVAKAVRTIKPNCLISLSPNPKDFAYTKFLQDWYTWISLGFIDELIVQVYRDDINNFKRELERPELQVIRQKIPVAVGILAGLRVQNVDMRQIQGQVKTARESYLDGFSFFFYETLGNRDASFSTLFLNPAIRPDLRNIASS
jgi:uncharacterized lipoprotein YddW (UPF0748 family)